MLKEHGVRGSHAFRREEAMVEREREREREREIHHTLTIHRHHSCRPSITRGCNVSIHILNEEQQVENDEVPKVGASLYRANVAVMPNIA